MFFELLFIVLLSLLFFAVGAFLIGCFIWRLIDGTKKSFIEFWKEF